LLIKWKFKQGDKQFHQYHQTRRTSTFHLKQVNKRKR